MHFIKKHEGVHSTFLFVYFNNTTRSFNKRKEKYCVQYTVPLGYKKHLIKKCESVHWCSHYFSFYSNVTPHYGVEIEMVHSTFLSVYFNNTTRGYNNRKEKYCEQYTFPLGYIKNAIKCTLSRSVKVFTVLFYLFISITQPGVQ